MGQLSTSDDITIEKTLLFQATNAEGTTNAAHFDRFISNKEDTLERLSIKRGGLAELKRGGLADLLCSLSRTIKFYQC